MPCEKDNVAGLAPLNCLARLPPPVSQRAVKHQCRVLAAPLGAEAPSLVLLLCRRPRLLRPLAHSALCPRRTAPRDVPLGRRRPSSLLCLLCLRVALLLQL